LANEAVVDFRIYRWNVSGWEDGGLELDGFVKFDGCMNMSTGGECMYHMCDPVDGPALLGALLRSVYHYAAPMLSHRLYAAPAPDDVLGEAEPIEPWPQ